MATDTKPNLISGKFEQAIGEVLNLSGTTYVFGQFNIKPAGVINNISTQGYKISGSTFLRAGKNELNSIFIGIGAGCASNISSIEENIGIGIQSLKSVSGNNNVAIGNYTLWSTTSGNNNVSLGTGAGRQITTGYHNIGIGSCSIGTYPPNNVVGSYNIGIGTFSLYNLSGGTRNIAVGTSAGCGIINGCSNIIFGNETGLKISTGCGNIVFGCWSGKEITTGCDNITIGNYAGSGITTQSNKLSISGGNGKELIGGCFTTGVIDFKYVKLLCTPATGTCVDKVLVWNSTDKCIKSLPYSSGSTLPSSYICAVTITGNGTLTDFTAQHNFGTTDVMAQVLDDITLANVYVDTYRPNTACVVVRFEDAPALNKTYRVLMSK